MKWFKLSIPLILFSLYSCDPAYYTMINNKTKYDKEIKVRVLNRNVAFYEGKEDIFKYGKLISEDSLPSSNEFHPVIILSGQTLRFKGIFIEAYKNDGFIIDNDTMDIRTSKYKKSGIPIKYAYSIE